MRKRSIPVLLPTLLVLGLLGAWAGTSAGQLPPPPTVTLPTVPLPPTVTVPPAPLPPAPPPPPLPTVMTPPATVPSTPSPPVDPPTPPVDLPVTIPGRAPETPVTPPPERPSGSTPLSGEEAPTSAGRHYGASSRIATITRIRASRTWVTVGTVGTGASHSERGVWITFWLSRARTVVFIVDELNPDCRYVGRFLIRGRAGRNQVPFRGRLRGRALDPGTYRLTAHPRGNRARRLTGVTVVIVERAPAAAEIAAARARNTCPGGTPPSLRAAAIAAAPEGGKPTAGVAGVQAGGTARRPYEDGALGGPLGTVVETLQSAADAVPLALFALAVLAVLLLGVAAMPQPLRASLAGATLVHHRGTIALAGVGVLIGALLSFALLQ